MKKLSSGLVVLTVLMLLASSGYAIVDWKQGLNSAPLAGTSNASDIDYGASNYLADPLDRLLINYIRGCTLTRTSATVITVSAGEVTCANGAGTIKRMRQNTATATMDMAVVGVGGIDSGSAEVVSTWYSLYAVADAAATTFTVIASQQGTALSDVTYYRYIGSVYNNAASDLSNFYWFGNGNVPLVMWDVPINISTAVSAGAWSGAISCATGMPNTSILGVFGLSVANAEGTYISISIRPNGSTWVTPVPGTIASEASSVNLNSIVGSLLTSGQRLCVTDSSQQIQNYNEATATSCAINVEGFYINR